MTDDTSLKALLEFLNAAEAGIVQAKRVIAEAKGISEAPAVREITFTILKWEKQTGNRLGEYEVAYKAHNLPEKFQSAFNILNRNNATIASRYHRDGYVYAYWLYGAEKIYRQKLQSA